jgi:tRNA (cytidine/uridine-2'-O-)-methyltransferase
MKVAIFAFKAKQCYTDAKFQPNDVLMFGPETRGLPDSILTSLPEQQRLRLPMLLLIFLRAIRK